MPFSSFHPAPWFCLREHGKGSLSKSSKGVMGRKTSVGLEGQVKATKAKPYLQHAVEFHRLRNTCTVQVANKTKRAGRIHRERLTSGADFV